MPRLKTVRGPKILSKNVTISQEYHRKNVNKLLITIKLPSATLKGVNEKQMPKTTSNIPHSASAHVTTGLNTADIQQNKEAPEMPNFPDWEPEEFDDLESVLNEALNQQPQTVHRRSSDSKKVDIVEALKLSPRRRSSESERNEKLGVESNKQLPEPTTPVKRRKTIKPFSRVREQRAEHYKSLPANIAPILESELRELEDADEDMPKVEKIVFSLKDPLGGGKIKLPVKSRFCSHFECFDYDNFCLFHNIPTSIKDMTRKNLIQHNFNEMARRKNGAQSSSQDSSTQCSRQATYQQIVPHQANLGSDYRSPMVIQQLKLSPYVKIVDNPLPGDSYTSRFIAPAYQTCPFYSCPICDTSFPLNALLISDSFNYFVKITSPSAEKIELLGSQKYRAIGGADLGLNAKNASSNKEDVLVISSDEEEENEKTRQQSATKQKMNVGNFIHRQTPVDWFESAVDTSNYNTDYDDHGASHDDPIILD
ncbi:hypothetical protein CANMA_002626 [Candida margitis]|uniref:uncharacterized protein n=1 Tax=Candida margitis TaxID=1775924 RepID=UPI002226B48F|nr:uncharacterized protein CANMA_002626 [Candida margitis]KAI5967858.1 hypothetical protein CANMA_002626 [Candida margitis]